MNSAMQASAPHLASWHRRVTGLATVLAVLRGDDSGRKT